MMPFLSYAMAGVALFSIGLYGLIAHAHLLRKIIALNIMAGGVFLLLVSIGYRNWDGMRDPVAQAMVLTGIVVAVGVTAFALALARHLYAATGQAMLPEEVE